MNIALALVTLTGITLAISGVMSQGLIPFPRIGRDGGGASGLHEVKRQLIPFPRVGKRVPMMMPMYMDPLYAEAAQYAPWYGMSNDAMVSAGFSTVDKDDNNIDLDKKNGANPNAGGGMWFGPRLGRKKRSIESSESSSEHYRDALDSRTLVKILHNFNWAIVPVKERRTFTPRLGRSSREISVHTRAQPLTPRLGRSREMVSAELDLDEDTPAGSRYARNEEHAIHGRSTQQPPTDASGPPFSPRLGRADHDHYSTQSARTGEDHE